MVTQARGSLVGGALSGSGVGSSGPWGRSLNFEVRPERAGFGVRPEGADFGVRPVGTDFVVRPEGANLGVRPERAGFRVCPERGDFGVRPVGADFRDASRGRERHVIDGGGRRGAGGKRPGGGEVRLLLTSCEAEELPSAVLQVPCRRDGSGLLLRCCGDQWILRGGAEENVGKARACR
jgi:hypothetical protein